MSESNPGDRDFRRQAEELLPGLPLLRDWLDLRQEVLGHERRAFIIEFAGMPKAGKSLAIETLRHFFSHGYRVVKVGAERGYINSPRHQYQVRTPAEGVSLRTPSVLKSNHVDFNAWAGAYGVQELLQAAHDTQNDLVILDRGPWDAGCWLKYWNDVKAGEGHSVAYEYVATIVDFLHLDHWMERSDLHVVLTIDPQEAALREQTLRLIEHGGFASNREGMEAIRRIYEERFESLKRIKVGHCEHVGDRSVLKLDTTDMRPHNVSLDIIRAVYRVLEAKINHHAADFMISPHFVEREMDGYLPPARKTRKELLGFLPEYLQGANDLSPVQRYRLKKLITQARAPSDLAVARTAKGTQNDNPIKRALEELLRKARAS